MGTDSELVVAFDELCGMSKCANFVLLLKKKQEKSKGPEYRFECVCFALLLKFTMFNLHLLKRLHLHLEFHMTDSL